MTKKKITISGMHCASCGNNITRSLQKVPGIREAKVSVMTNKAILEADEKVSNEEISKAVSRAGGYKVLKIE
jgi:copper chaperone CopZ